MRAAIPLPLVLPLFPSICSSPKQEILKVCPGPGLGPST